MQAVFTFEVRRKSRTTSELLLRGNRGCNGGREHAPVSPHCGVYRGKMTIDPGTGSILRLVVEADLKRASRDKGGDHGGVGSVEIGGKTYICP